jgi:hypothetical protein
MSSKVYVPRIRRTWELGNYYHTKLGTDRFYNKSALEKDLPEQVEVELEEDDYEISQLRNKFKSLNHPVCSSEPAPKRKIPKFSEVALPESLAKSSRYMMRKCNYDFAYEKDCM